MDVHVRRLREKIEPSPSDPRYVHTKWAWILFQGKGLRTAKDTKRGQKMDGITIRTAVPADLDAVVQVEAACFPAAEAADRKSLKERLDVFPQSFLVAEDGNRIIGFINGAVTNERTIGDEMFEDTSLHERRAPTRVYSAWM